MRGFRRRALRAPARGRAPSGGSRGRRDEREEIEAEREQKRQRTRADEGATSPNEKEERRRRRHSPVVSFDACLARFAADETVEDWFSTATGAKGAATRRSRFATFPGATVQVRRYSSRATGRQEAGCARADAERSTSGRFGVWGSSPARPSFRAADAAAAAVPEIPTDAPQYPPSSRALSSGSRHRRAARGMGFSEAASPGATRNAGASRDGWVFAHMEDPDFNDPYVPATGAALTGNSAPCPPRRWLGDRGRLGGRDARHAMGSPKNTPRRRWNAPARTSSARRIGSFQTPTTWKAPWRRRRRSRGAAPAARGRRVDPLRPRVLGASPCVDGPATSSFSGSCRTWAGTRRAATTSRTSSRGASGASSTTNASRGRVNRRSTWGTCTFTGARREAFE